MACPRLVQIAVGLLKIKPKEITGESFLEHVEAERAAIQFDQRVRNPRRGDTGGAKQFAAQRLIQVAGIFNRVVQVDFAQPMEFLPWKKFAEVQRQRRLVVQAPEA